MIDFAALRERTGLKADNRCVCGSRVFSCTPLLVTNPDGRSLSSYQGEGMCGVYVLRCLCGLGYILSRNPAGDQENTLIPALSPEAKEFLEPAMPDFTNFPEVHVEK